MNSEELTNILSLDPGKKTRFGGVLPRDLFIQEFGKFPRGKFIFNTEYSDQSGEHWVSVIATQRKISYFDSYGRSPVHYPDVWYCLISSGLAIEWNEKRLQGLLSTVCGDYCLLFCLLYDRGWTLKRFADRMEKIPDTEERDHSVRELMLRLYGKAQLKNLLTSKRGLEGKDGVHIPGCSIILSSM